MAVARDQEASSSTLRCAYDVFLSFKGDDTRKTFTDHLYTALDNAGFHTFRDDDGIEKGENIDIELQRAIQESKISIIVISKDYASSIWCLNELVRILKRKNTSKHQVLPVFYHVNPSDVKKQSGSFKESFLRFEEMFKAMENERRSDWMDKIKEWRAALIEVASLAGMVLQNQVGGYESKFIQKILTVIEDKLKRTISSNGPFLIGLEARARDINLWLENASTEVNILAICGMGGIGKTTIARHVYDRNFHKFRGSSFLANVRETCEQPNGLVYLQKQLLLDILNRKQKIHNVYEGADRIKYAVFRKKIFVVLDDVDQIDQINLVLEFRDWLYPGSKILITTRHEGLLKGVRNHMVHKVEYLDYYESFKLFTHYAFYRDNPPEDYVEHAKRAVMQCGGLPLALKVLGSTLRGEQRVQVWINALEKFEAIPDNQILKKLRISYDSLSDDHDKNLFLDIACFFVGEDEDSVRIILDGFGFFTIIGIQNLIDRCMLEIENKKLMMHQWLRDMGREIVFQESPREPERRSRLWRHNDSFKVLSQKTGTDTIEGLILNMHTLKEDNSIREIVCANKKRRLLNLVDTLFGDFNEVALETSSFERMHNLRLLQLYYVKLKGDYKNFPKELKFLVWHGFLLKYIPRDLCLERLVALDMSYSKFIEAWKGPKVLGLLKTLVLSHSPSLVKILNFVAVPNLERLILEDCASLVEVHESIGNLEGLVLLDLKDCINLRKLPESIVMLKFLERLIISGCSNLVQLPADMKKMESLKVFHADGTTINQSVSVSWKVKPWHVFVRALAPVLRRNSPVTYFLPSLPPSLVTLSLADCNLSDDAFPRDFSSLPFLLDLNLSGNSISKLPDFVRSFTRLRKLSVRSCTKLQSLIELPSMVALNIMDCPLLERVIGLHPLGVLFSEDVIGAEFIMEGDNFKFEPIGKVDAVIMDSLGLCNLESVSNTEMNYIGLYLADFKKQKKLPTQGLHEYGFIFSTFILGRQIPVGWLLSNKISSSSSRGSSSSSLSFIVPSCSLPNHKIRSLNFYSIYALSNEKEIWNPPPLFTKISNKSTGLNWIYGPTIFVIPQGDEHITWLSQWKVGNRFQMNAGDEVNLTVVVGVGFQVKECGIDIVYCDEQENHEEIQQQISLHPNPQGFSPPNPLIGGAYILSYLGKYYAVEQSSKYHHWSSSDWGKKLCEDSTLTAEEFEEAYRHFWTKSMEDTRAKVGDWEF